MTQNTIDLAIATLNLNIPSDTASPGNTGICGGKPPFGKSLQEAMQTTDINNGIVGCDAEQFLPPAGQELPLQSAYNYGLEGITEVRALADAISEIARGAATDADSPLDQFDKALVASRSNPAAATALAGGAATDADGPLDQFDKALVASRSNPAAATALRSAFGFDPANSEGVDFDSRQEIGVPAGTSNDNIKRQIGSLNGTLSSGLHEPRIAISDAVLITETTNSKDSASRSLSLDPGLGLSSTTQAESKFVNRANALQVPQQPLMTKSAEVVSSNELATHLRVLKSSGGGEARLQLHPAELGRMTVSLITEGDEARVSFVVDNPQAKQAVEVSLPRLRDLMDEAGLSLTDADVSDRHAKENEDQSVEQVIEETTANSGSDAEDFDEFTPPTSAQLVDTFV
ncbi:MAG: flagellar hook-length control protein FliK [Luminiphilus sp.]